MTATGPGQRIAALDLVRGIAVLGILAVNIGGFAGPMGASFSPHVAPPVGAADEAAYAVMLVLFEGKMRMLFSLLFGASMMLFIERAEARGVNGDALQARRLCWLALFGAAHYVLLWWGDILFAYAVIGFVALVLRRQPESALVVVALMIFTGWALTGIAATLGDGLLAHRIAAGTATPQELTDNAETLARMLRSAQDDLAEYRLGFWGEVRARLHRPFWQIGMAANNVWEILPMMLIGMTLQRTGFFAGDWPRRWLWRMALAGIGAGGLLTVLIVGWAWHLHFPPPLMASAVHVWMALPHLAMALGYAAALALAAPRLLASRAGPWLVAAGRMAFSNYLGTTLVMTAIFSGWGLGLIGTVPVHRQALFVLLGWALMLGWSRPWLAHFRQGPLEWAWRSLTEWRLLPMKR